MKRKRKRTEKEKLKDKADRLWSCAVRADWGDRCAMCGTRDSLNAHHIVPCQHTTTRYTLRNGMCLCVRCHRFCPTRSPHQNADGWLQWLTEHHPTIATWYQETNQTIRGQRPITKNVQYYHDTIRQLREYVDDDDYRRILGSRLADWLERDE